MRTIPVALNQAAQADSRRGVARVTLRDTLLRFNQSLTTLSNPWSLGGAAQLAGEDFCAGSARVLSDGRILRAFCGPMAGFPDQAIHLNLISDPTVTAQWSVWRSLEPIIGWPGDFTGNLNTNVAIAELAGTVYLFWIFIGSVVVSSCPLASLVVNADHDPGPWSAPISAGVAIPAGPAHLAVGHFSSGHYELFASVVSGAAIRLYGLLYQGGVWTTNERPWFQDGNLTYPVSATSYDSTTFFDAGEVGGRTFIVTSFGPTGACHIVEFKSGVWGNPAVLLPNDYSHFHPYRLSVIQGRAWLSGRLERNNEAAWSPAWDMYLYSDDGVNWTACARDSFLCLPSVRGQLLLSRGVLYYAGLDRLTSAPATWLVDPAGDPAARKLVLGNARQAQWADTADFSGLTVYDDLVNVRANAPGAGTAPTLALDLANGDESWYHAPKSSLLAPEAELTLEAGYVTDGEGGETYALYQQASLDSFQRDDSTGARQLQLQARDTLFKRLNDYPSLFYWPFMSQTKHVDLCDDLSGLVALSGTWTAKPLNLLNNPGFELPFPVEDEHHPWSHGLIWSLQGPGAGTWTRTQEVPAEEGLWSGRLEKLDGDPAQPIRVEQQVAVLAGHSYTFSGQAEFARLTGGTGAVKLIVTGGLGAAGATLTVTDLHLNPLSDPVAGSVWVLFSLTLSVLTDNYAFCSLELTSVGTGLAYLDNFKFYDNDLQITMTDENLDGLAYATDPPDTVDFDIRATWEDGAVPSPDRIGMGLIGCVVDKSNLILFQVYRTGSGSGLSLYKKRGGRYTQLADSAYAWDPAVKLDLRLVHRQGHLWCYVKRHSDSLWTGPVFTTVGYDHFVWDPATHGPIIPSASGRGLVGVRAAVVALSFPAMLADTQTRVIALASSDAGDWSAFPSSGQVQWGDSEICTYTRKTAASEVYTIQQPEQWGGCKARRPGDAWLPLDWWWKLNLTQLEHADGSDAGQPNLGLTAYDGGTQLVPAGGIPNTQAGYAAVFRAPDSPGAAWEILMAYNLAAHPAGDTLPWPMALRLSGTGGLPLGATPTAAWNAWAGGVAGPARAGGPGLVPDLLSGYETTFPAKYPLTQDGGPGGYLDSTNMDLRLAPCLANVTRAQNGTAAIGHLDGESVKVWYSGAPRLSFFQANDMATDLNSERHFARSSALAGVMRTRFNSAHVGSRLATFFGFFGDWSGVALADNLVDTVEYLHRHNLDYSVSFPAISEGDGWGLHYHALITSDVIDRTSGRRVLFYMTGGVLYCEFGPGAIALADGGPTTERQVCQQLPLETNEVRVVISGAWTTVYLNGSCVSAYYCPEQDADAGDEVAAWVKGSDLVGFLWIGSGRIPELDDWRDALRFDIAESVSSFFDQITEDRPYFYVSRSGQALYFSTFAHRELLTPNDLEYVIEPFKYRLLDDQSQATDADRFSFARVEAIGILEFLDAGLAAAGGFRLKLTHMTKAENRQADAMTQRSFQIMQEGLLIELVDMGANLRFETEDAFFTHYTDPATGTVTARALVVNDLTLDWNGQGLLMAAGARAWTTAPAAPDPGAAPDPPPAGVPVTSGLLLNLQADLGVHTSGSDVTVWDDQSGQSHNFTDGGGDPPTLATVAGKQEVVLDGAAYLAGPVIADNLGSLTAFVVAKIEADTSSSIIVGNVNNTDNGQGWQVNLEYAEMTVQATFASGNGYVDVGDSGLVDTGSFHLLAGTLSDRSTLGVRFDRTDIVNAGSGFINLSGPVVDYSSGLPVLIGTNHNQSQFSHIHVQAVMLYSPALSPTDRAAVETYLHAKWGTP